VKYKRGYKENILKLRAEGKSYSQIRKELGCSETIISYHLNLSTRNRAKHQSAKTHPFQTKLYRFKRTDCGPKNINFERKRKKTINDKLLSKIKTFHKILGTTMSEKSSFTVKDIINKFGEKPKCYLTGIELDIYDTKTYQFDHIIPRSRGGQNTLDNLGIASTKANQCKNNMTPDEFMNMCKLVLEHNGYNITKN